MKVDSESESLEPYVKVVNKNTELFSPYTAETLLDALKAYCTEKGVKYELKNDKHKMKIHFSSEEVDLECKILSVDEATNVIDFQRLNGGCMSFFDQYAHIKDFLEDLVYPAKE
jgi:hypothetical protein